MIVSNKEIPFDKFPQILTYLDKAYGSLPVSGKLDIAQAATLLAVPMAGGSNGFVALSITDDKEIDGILIGGSYRNVLEGIVVAESRMLFGNNKSAMVSAFETWGKANSVDEVYVSVPSGSEFKPEGFTSYMNSYGKKVKE